MHSVATLYVERDGDEVELEVRGRVDQPLSEGGGAEVTAVFAVTLTGATMPWDGELTEDETDRAEEELAEAAYERISDYFDDSGDEP